MKSNRFLSIAVIVMGAAGLSVGAGLIGSLAGCSQFHQTKPGVPTGSYFLMEGTGQLTYTAQKDGKIFLYDKTTKKQISGFFMEKGQTFTFNPATGETEVTGGKRGGKSKFNVTDGNTFSLHYMDQFKM
jgi:hypothetical protein